MRITVLGSSNAVPRPGRACSAYLVEAAGQAVALDFGTGALGNLRRHREPETLAAVFISHMHADHFIDVVALRYALKYGERTHDRRVALWLPPSGEAMLRRMCSTFAAESDHDFLNEVFEVREYDPAERVAIGDLEVRFAAGRHYIECFAMRCEHNGRSATYSADTAPSDEVVDLARNGGAFLCEATLLRSDSEYEPRGHCTPAEAAEMGRRAEVKHLMLTHYSTASNPETMLEQARDVFGEATEVADDHRIFEV